MYASSIMLRLLVVKAHRHHVEFNSVLMTNFSLISAIPTFTEFTQTIPDSNSSELVANVKLSGRCYCIFPPPSEVKLYYREGVSMNINRILLLS